jgi:hypothetical protein
LIPTPFTALVRRWWGENEFKPAFDWLEENKARLRKALRNPLSD